MKAIIQKVLKLWSFEVAKRNGSHFEKMALKDFMSFCIFSVAVGVQSQPNFLIFVMVIHWICYHMQKPPRIFLIGLYVVNHNHLHHKMLACCSIRTKIE